MFNVNSVFNVNQCIREKTGAQNIVKEIKQCQERWLHPLQRMDTNRIPKQALQYKPKGRRTWDDRGRDGGTNFVLRIKEQETRLILHENDDDDDDDDVDVNRALPFRGRMKETVSRYGGHL
jgi:hypothetical protein